VTSLPRIGDQLFNKPHRRIDHAFNVSSRSLVNLARPAVLAVDQHVVARKHDKDASEEIATRHGAQSDAGRYHKILLPKAALAEIQKIVSEARQEHYFMTLPWDDNGYRVLPAAVYMDHVEKMRTLSKPPSRLEVVNSGSGCMKLSHTWPTA
jgi:hypothetical protein